MKQKYIFTYLLIFLSSMLMAQETHILGRYEFDIDGKTRESALLKEMDLKEGTEFESLEDLQYAVSRQEQDLVNLRVFNAVSLTLNEGTREGDTVIHSVLLKSEDSWTIYPIPYPKYSSNDGFRLGIKTFYDNAFGSLNNLFLGMSVTFNQDKYYDEFRITEWSINPQLNEVKIGNLEYDFSFTQQYSISEKKDEGVLLEHYNYHNTSFSVSTKLAFGSDNKFYYRVTPDIGLKYGYTGLGYDGNEEPLYLGFNHSIGYSKVDWFGNFREGYSASVGNSLKYVIVDGKSNQFKASVDGEAKWYKILHPRFNYSTRLYGIVTLNDELTGLGSNLRGVEDSTMFGRGGIFFSNDMNIAVIKWKGVGEAQFQPFFDIGYSRPMDGNTDWGENLRYSTGADFILYLDKLKGLHARASIGVDLSSDLPFSDFGKYGIEITSSLAY